MLSNLLQDESNPSDSDLREIKFGFDTTVWSIYAFFKTMVLYPDVQAQAQAETDAVIGDNRLPMVEDHERLPFLSALAMEDMSWPQQAFHIVLQKMIGYLIPKGALIIPNIWHVPFSLTLYLSNVLLKEDGPRSRRCERR